MIVRAHDRQGRGQPAKCSPTPPTPRSDNGGFEEVTGDPPVPVGWHYQRQLKVESGRDAPQGQRYVTFSNTTPGRNAHAMQGFAIDGRKVPEIELSFEVRCKDMPAEYQRAPRRGTGPAAGTC